MRRLLVVEDNPKVAGFIEQGLSEQDYEVDVAGAGKEGEELAASRHYDAIVLDIMLPDVDGITVCRNLRKRGVATPILMLTALGTTADKVTGLDAGADDYLAKPFEFGELVARIRSLLRRGQGQPATVLRCADLEINLLTRKATRGGRSIKLTTKEFALLEVFVRNQDQPLTRGMIGERVWDMNFDCDSNVIDVYVSLLRRKIDKGFPVALIRTVIGTGYMMRSEE